MGLSFEEFEVLQAIVRRGGASESWLNDDLFLPQDGIQKAISNLLRNSLVRCKNDQILPSKKNALAALEPYIVKRAVILAAGRGERMRPETHHTPKPMVRVGNKLIIETQIDALHRAGITDITIVRGYLGQAYDQLLSKYPNLKFIDNPHWQTKGAIMSAWLALDLLAGAYLLEGDIFIKNPDIVRPYEYRSSYCASLESVVNDWYFETEQNNLIKSLAFGNQTSVPNKAYRFVGILFVPVVFIEQLASDIGTFMEDPANHQGFIETVLLDAANGSYDIYARPLKKGDAIEIDTYEELLALRQKEVAPRSQLDW